MAQLKVLADDAIIALLGDRIRQERLNQNITQKHLAQRCGVSPIVVQRLEAGRGCSLKNFIRILRSLGKVDQIDTLLPEPGPSPLELARRSGQRRKEASGGRGRWKKEPKS